VVEFKTSDLQGFLTAMVATGEPADRTEPTDQTDTRGEAP
jgi:hypothetical protein